MIYGWDESKIAYSFESNLMFLFCFGSKVCLILIDLIKQCQFWLKSLLKEHFPEVLFLFEIISFNNSSSSIYKVLWLFGKNSIANLFLLITCSCAKYSGNEYPVNSSVL